MPTEASHISLAVRNQAALDHLCSDPPAFLEWIATVAFYKALHVVEAMFTHHQWPKHCYDHGQRAKVLKRPEYSHIWPDYHQLWVASMIARYLKARSRGQYTSFSQYMSPEQVQSLLVDQHLHNIQKAACRFLSQAAQRTLGSTP